MPDTTGGMFPGYEPLIAMSEDGDWFAYRKEGLTRSQAMSRVARGADDLGYGSWHETLTRYRVLARYVAETTRGWWEEVAPSHPGSTPAWIVCERPRA